MWVLKSITNGRRNVSVLVEMIHCDQMKAKYLKKCLTGNRVYVKESSIYLCNRNILEKIMS